MDGSQYVSKLNEISQKRDMRPPEYKDLGSSGPDHMKIFKQQVYFNGKLYPEAEGDTKKKAKHNAAKNAYEVLRREQQEPAAATSKSAEPLGQDLNHVSNRTGDFNKLCEKTSELNVSLPKSTEDYMTKVNLYCQKTRREWNLIEETPEAQSQMPFAFRMKIDQVRYPVGTGRNKQEARQKAAELAWSALQQPTDADSEASVRSTESWDDQSRKTSTSSTASSCQELSDDVTQPNSGSSSIQFKDSSPVQHSSGAQGNVMEKSTKNEVTTKTSRFTSEYDNIEPLQKGSYGHVYKARKIEMETYCAIKEIKILNKLPEEKAKSLLEVKALYTLLHENIVRYYTSWFEDTGYSQVVKPNVQYLFIEMELCDGGTLRSWISKKNKDPKERSREQESLKFTGQILNAVEYIHNKNFIHRDLKPENILFGGDGKVRIGDFGLVTSDSNDGEVVERTEARGTESYMAPEQFGTEYDRKVDIFALGLIFFELFSRISTYHERLRIWKNVRNQDFPKDFTETYAVESRIIKTMLSKKPEDRPDASALKSELEKWTQKEEIQLRTY